MANAPFPVQAELTAISIAYQNKSYIGDSVLPRVPVGKQDFKYTVWAQGESFTQIDTKVGRKGRPNEIEFSGTETQASCQGFGLDDTIPFDDIENAPQTYDVVGSAIARTTDLIMLDREQRVAGLVFDSNQYAASNKTTLAGITQWSDFANSDPLLAMLLAMDSCIIRPNVAVMGQTVYSKIRTHPKVVQAFYGNAASAGVVPREYLAEILELDEVLVGDAFVNSARKGQAAAMVRLWGKHCSLIYRNKFADTEGGPTFGYTAQWGDRIAGGSPDTQIGLRGGIRARVGEYVKEIVCANDLGYMFVNAVA